MPPTLPATTTAAEGEPRILSLLSAATEIVCRLGLSSRLVGRSHGCDQPPLATTRPICTAPFVDPNAPSGEIDLAVRAVAEDGGPVYHIRSAEVAALRPTVIIAQNQCRICAVTEADVNAACQNLPACTVVTIQPTTLDDVLGDITTIARAAGVPGRGERLVRHLRDGFDEVRRHASSAAAAAGVTTPPKVCHVEWLAPLMGSGYWIHECVAAAGGAMVHGSPGGNSGTLPGLASLADAEVLVIAPCGFSIERTAAELDQLGLRDDPAWKALPAVAAGRVFVADGNLYYNRSSCGVLETAQMTAEMIWPELTGLWGNHGQRHVAIDELDAFCSRAGAPAVLKPVQVESTTKRRRVGEAAGLPLGAAGATGPGTEQRPTAAQSSPSGAVKAQLASLGEGRFAEAFELNSAANRQRFGSAGSFEAVVKSSASFRMLLGPGCKTSLSPVEGAEDSVKVAVVAGGQTASFVFDLVKSATGQYFTDGVRIEC